MNRTLLATSAILVALAVPAQPARTPDGTLALMSSDACADESACEWKPQSYCGIATNKRSATTH